MPYPAELDTIASPGGAPISTSRSDRKIDVSIVIVSWNTRDILRGCLNSVLEQTKNASFEVILIDNNSHDGSSDMVRRDFPQFNLIANAENRGFAAACNQGMLAASGRYILLLNPDTIVLDDAISRCIHYADLHTDVGVVGCQVLEGEDRDHTDGLFISKSVEHLFGSLRPVEALSSVAAVWPTGT